MTEAALAEPFVVRTHEHFPPMYRVLYYMVRHMQLHMQLRTSAHVHIIIGWTCTLILTLILSTLIFSALPNQDVRSYLRIVNPGIVNPGLDTAASMLSMCLPSNYREHDNKHLPTHNLLPSLT